MQNKFLTQLDILGIKKRKKQKDIDKNINFGNPQVSIESLDELLKKDEQREKDGFTKKIKIGRILVGPGKVIMVPHVTEEKLLHGEFEPSQNNQTGEPGKGEGNIGDVIGRKSPFAKDGCDGDSDEGNGAGEGGGGEHGGEHGVEAEAYKLGKELSAKFKLPNLKDKGKKVPTDEYVYDLTDRHRSSGQLLDKKATLKSIIKTNIALGRIDKDHLDAERLIVAPNDKVFRVLSRERVWKSQAIVFFLRDYSESMYGEPTKAVVNQHLMIYSWLLVQYEKLIIPRFVIHDTDAEEVSAKRYFIASAGGGTIIASGYKKINEIVDGEGLARDYNIYVFQGTDGDDFDDGKLAIPEVEKILGYANRFGVSVLKHPYYGKSESRFEAYIKKGSFLDQKNLFRMHIMTSAGVTEDKNAEAVKALISQE